jgi:hypothetical protein
MTNLVITSWKLNNLANTSSNWLPEKAKCLNYEDDAYNYRGTTFYEL